MKMHVDIKVAWIGFAGALLVALVGMVAQDPFGLFGGKEELAATEMPDVAEPERLVAVPTIGTAIEFQIFAEDFEKLQPGWPLNRNAYLEGGRLHINYPELSGTVHPFMNDHYQIGRGPFSASFRSDYLGGADWTYGLVLKAVGRQEFVFLSLREDMRWRLTHLGPDGWTDVTDWDAMPSGAGPGTVITVSNIALEGGDTDSILNESGLESEDYDSTLYVYADAIEVGTAPNLMRDVGKQFGVFTTSNIHAAFDDIVINDMSQANYALLEDTCLVHIGQEFCPSADDEDSN